VSFTPHGTDLRPATLELFDDASDSPQTASLRGSGTGPAVRLSAGSLSFNGAGSKQVVLTNTGTGPLSITLIRTNNSDYQTTGCGSSLAAGASCTITITFNGSSTPDSGQLQIFDALGEQTVSLVAT
jgi:hypothetical protein